MRTVLVTGTAGFIGFHLSRHLIAEGFRVVGVHPDAFVLKDGAMKKAYLMQLKIR